MRKILVTSMCMLFVYAKLSNAMVCTTITHVVARCPHKCMVHHHLSLIHLFGVVFQSRNVKL